MKKYKLYEKLSKVEIRSNYMVKKNLPCRATPENKIKDTERKVKNR